MIDKDSSTPMYEQIASQLKQEILEQKFGAGGNIGAHTQLAKRFGVSLITVRKAVQLLADQGLLNVAQGKGTFVKNTALQDNLTRLTGASNIIWESRLSAQIQAPVFEIIDTPASFDSDIRQGLGEKCLHIQRIHLVEGSPIAYAEIYIPQKYGEQLSKADVEQYTIYQLYENKWKVGQTDHPGGPGLPYRRQGPANSRGMAGAVHSAPGLQRLRSAGGIYVDELRIHQILL